ncbi:MAG: Phenylacetic acid catabolic protein, partial [Hydrogenophaga sp.]|nr:Phenylacetic acid catabolic protein [Hydrogenophaga sp.]
TGVRLTELQANWNALVDETLTEATLQRPSGAGFVPQGQLDVHSEHMGFLVAEMQSLARNHPEAVW